jgi:Zn-dependent protease with chaperone function
MRKFTFVLLLCASIWLSLAPAEIDIPLHVANAATLQLQSEAEQFNAQGRSRSFWDYPANRVIIFRLVRRVLMLSILIVMVWRKVGLKSGTWLGPRVRREWLSLLAALSLLALAHWTIRFVFDLLQQRQLEATFSGGYTWLNWLGRYILRTGLYHLYFLAAVFLIFRLIGHWLPSLCHSLFADRTPDEKAENETVTSKDVSVNSQPCLESVASQLLKHAPRRILDRVDSRIWQAATSVFNYVAVSLFFLLLATLVILLPPEAEKYLAVRPLITQSRNTPRAAHLQAELDEITRSVGVKPVVLLEERVSDYTTATNAEAGLRSKSGEGIIVVHDTLVDKMPDGQAVFSIAHELSHVEWGAAYRFNYLAVMVFACLTAVYLLAPRLGPAHLTGGVPIYRAIFGTTTIPVWGLVVVALLFVYDPLLNRAGRDDESRADCDAVRLTVLPGRVTLDDAVGMVETQNVGGVWDPTRPPLLEQYGYDHPPQAERQEKIRQCAKLYTERQ